MYVATVSEHGDRSRFTHRVDPAWGRERVDWRVLLRAFSICTNDDPALIRMSYQAVLYPIWVKRGDVNDNYRPVRPNASILAPPACHWILLSDKIKYSASLDSVTMRTDVNPLVLCHPPSGTLSWLGTPHARCLRPLADPSHSTV
jgi:hypothetical protein